MVEGMDRLVVKAKNVAHAEEGDEVELYLNTRTKFKGYFVLYILPVLGLVIGALSADNLSRLLGLNANLGLVLFTFSGLVLAMFLVRYVSNRMEVRGELTPSVTRVLKRSSRVSAAIPTEAPSCACGVSGGGKLP
jgi:positive regulator of sigma E activity